MAMASHRASCTQAAPATVATSGVAYLQGGPPLRRVATPTGLLPTNPSAVGGRAPPPAGAAAITAAAMSAVTQRMASAAQSTMRPVPDPLGASRRSSSAGARNLHVVTAAGFEASGQPEGRWKAQTGGGSTSSTMSWDAPANALWHAKVQPSPVGSGRYAIGAGIASPQGGSARLANGINGLSYQYAGGSSLVSSDGGSHKVPQGTATWSSVPDLLQSASLRLGIGGNKATPFVSLSPAASREGSLKLTAASHERGYGASAASDATAPQAAPCDSAGMQVTSPAAGGSQRVLPWRPPTASPYVGAAGPVPPPFVSSVPSSSARSYSAMPSRPAPSPSPRGLSQSQAASTGQLPSASPQPGLTQSQPGSHGRLPIGPASQPGSHGRLPIGPPPQGLTHSQSGSAGRLPIGPPKDSLPRSSSSGRLPPGPVHQGLQRSQSANAATLGQGLAPPLTGSSRGSTGATGKSVNGSAAGGTAMTEANRNLSQSMRVTMVAPAGTPTQVLPYVPPGKPAAETREPSPDQVLLYVPPGSEGGSEKFSLTPSPTMQYREVQVACAGTNNTTEVDMASKLRLLENEVLRLNRMLEEEQKVSASLRGALEEGAKAMKSVSFDGPGSNKADISDETEALTAVDESRIEERLSDATLSPAPWQTFSPPRPLGSPPLQTARPPFPDGTDATAQYQQFSYIALDGTSRNVNDGTSRNGSPNEDRVETAAFAAVERLRSMNDHGGAAIAEKILASLRTGPGNSSTNIRKDPLGWDQRHQVKSG